MLFNVSAHALHSGRGGVDGGYPCSVQLSDGTLVTAYYRSRIPGHQRYHMGAVFWED